MISRLLSFSRLSTATLTVAFASFLWSSTHAAASEARLLRFPAIHGDQIIFGYAGDLYTVRAQGGIARRLTSDEDGYEMFPRFSPDGNSIAYTAQYDGNTEVYLMPAQGGEPKRLTYTATLDRDDVSDRMGPNNIVLTWRDNETIVYRSRRAQWNAFKGELTLAKISGGSPEILPLPRGGWCSFSPDGKQLAYNRVFREFRTWKRYRGGQADEIWLYNFDTKETTKLTEDPGQDVFPMWRNDKIYFVSDRDENRQANLFVMDVNSKETRQLTHFTDFAVKFPSLGDKAIVFENAGYIYRFDLETEKAEKVVIEIYEDLAIGRGGWKDVSKSTSGYDISSDGNRAVIGARGDLFSVPAKNGPTRNLTETPGIHERSPAWSPDGKWIAYISDQSGEDEIWICLQDGAGKPRQLTTGGDAYKYDLLWSPDSKHIAWNDKKNRLQLADVESGEAKLVIQSDAWEIHQFSWSPDSQWLTFVEPRARKFSVIQIYSLADGSTTTVTDGWFDSGNPIFSADGKYLFFVSERSFNPTYSQTEWNHVFQDMQRIYLVTLAKDTKSPFAPKSDEVKVVEEKKDKPKDEGEEKREEQNGEKKKADDKKEDEKKKEVVVRVDSDGIQQRITVLPAEASNYGRLASVGQKLYYTRKGKLHFYDFEKEKETEVGDIAGYQISADKKKMLVRVRGDFAIVDLPGGKLDIGDKKLNLQGLKVRLDRLAEWQQIYNESWRQMRDFFYDPGMHGVDWPAMRERYQPLLEHVRHRADLTYVIGEMISELNVGHAYVGGGDYPQPERVKQGLLGAVLQRDESGYYRITKILPGHNWDSKYRSPLTGIGVNIKEGDLILAVNGKSTKDMTDIYEALAGQADAQITLRINSEPSEDGARVETVIPTDNEQPLYYLEWVLGNIKTVEEATGGKVGYVHVPDMGVPGLNEFAKFYYPQLHKTALIVDCRGNGGGNVSPMIIERLRREPAMWTIARNGAVNVDPTGQVLGPKVLLIDQHSASDGDIVAYRFKKHQLGPVIGQRSWGGVVGIRGTLPLLDGGFLNRPEFSRFSLSDHEWVMEGHGVDPDIEIDNDPAREFAGTDDQLNRAIEEIQKALAENPVQVPEVPPYPNKQK